MDNWCKMLCARLRGLQQQYSFCDSIIISGEDDIFPLHTCILVSVVDEKILPEPEANAPHFSLRLENVPSKVVDRLVSFFYSGQIDQNDLTVEEKNYLAACWKSLGVSVQGGRLPIAKEKSVCKPRRPVPRKTCFIKETVCVNSLPDHHNSVLNHAGNVAKEDFVEQAQQCDEFIDLPAVNGKTAEKLVVECSSTSDLLASNSTFELASDKNREEPSLAQKHISQLPANKDSSKNFKEKHEKKPDETRSTCQSKQIPPHLDEKNKNDQMQIDSEEVLVDLQQDDLHKTQDNKSDSNRLLKWFKSRKNNKNFSYSQYVDDGEALIENGKRKYICKQCGFTKNSMESFVVHKLQVHEGYIPFSCSKCTKGFYRKYDCTRHERTCSGKRRTRTTPNWERNQLPNKMLAKLIAPGELDKKDSHRKFYKCSLCSKVVVTFETFVSHKFEHADIRPFSCARCGQAFLRLSETRRHVLYAKSCKESLEPGGAHPVPHNHGSNVIDAQGVLIDTDKVEQAIQILSTAPPPKHKLASSKKASTSAELNQYVEEGELRVINKIRSYKCRFCGKTINNLITFAAHKMKHANLSHYHCKLCNKGFRLKTALSRHLARHLANELTCPTCAENFETQEELFSHMQRKEDCQTGWETTLDRGNPEEGGCSLSCKFCPKVFTCEEYLEKHVDLKHCKIVRPFRCNQCSISFRLEDNYVLHMEKHVAGHTSFTCASCGRTFERRTDFNSHILTHRRDYRCFHCSKTFRSVSSLKLHQAIHSGVKPFLCKVCGRTFTQKGNLVKHEHATHAVSKMYSCTDCSRTFSSDAGRRWHKKVTHRKYTRMYVCSICRKTFHAKDMLQKHFLTHTDYKPFKCPLCEKFFRSKAHVQSHCKCKHKLSKEDLSALHIAKIENEKALAPYATRPFWIMPRNNAVLKADGLEPVHTESIVPEGQTNDVSQQSNTLTEFVCKNTPVKPTPAVAMGLKDMANETLVSTSAITPDLDLIDSSLSFFGDSMEHTQDSEGMFSGLEQDNTMDLSNHIDENGQVLLQVIGDDGSVHHVRMQPDVFLSSSLLSASPLQNSQENTSNCHNDQQSAFPLDLSIDPNQLYNLS